MAWRMLCQMYCVFLMLTGEVHATEHVRHLQPIQFVVVNHNGPAVTLSPGASVTELHGAIAESHNVSFPFELHLSRETIVSSQSLTNQSLSDIHSIVAIAKDLADLHGPGFRIPLKLHRVVPLDEDFTTFASLARMFGAPHSNIHEFEWYQFVIHSLESRSCDLELFCARFKKLFFCADGKIWLIHLEGQRIRGHVDLAATPRTVRKIKLRGNMLTKIMGLDQSVGKELRTLDIRANPVEIDLNLLESTPLKIIQVKICQIGRCLVGKRCWTYEDSEAFTQAVLLAAIQWVESSTLDVMIIGGKRVKRIERRGQA